LMIGAARALADSLIQVLLSLVVATMFWTNGDRLMAMLHEALRRLGGPIAEQALDVAAEAISGVAYGVVGTAAIQAVLLALGLAVAGVPGASMLRTASDLYNRSLTSSFASADRSRVVLQSGRFEVPFGTIDITYDPTTARWGDLLLSEFTPADELHIQGLQNRYRQRGSSARSERHVIGQ